MDNSGPIDFQLVLLLNIDGNNGQNKFEVHISKNVVKIANFRPKDATFVPILYWHNSVIFYPYLTFLDFDSWFTFCSKALHLQHWVYGPKTTLKLLVQVLTTALNPYSSK